jgi:hypothetical protein
MRRHVRQTPDVGSPPRRSTSSPLVVTSPPSLTVIGTNVGGRQVTSFNSRSPGVEILSRRSPPPKLRVCHRHAGFSILFCSLLTYGTTVICGRPLYRVLRLPGINSSRRRRRGGVLCSDRCSSAGAATDALSLLRTWSAP